MAARHWKDVPERGSPLGIAILRAVMRVGGLSVIRVVLAPVVLYYLLTHATARAASRDYLVRLNAYCRKRGVPCPLRADWRGIYRHLYSFALSIAEKHAAWSGAFADSTSIYQDGLEISRQVEEGEQGVVLLASHLGNFDISIAFGAFDTDRRFRVLIDHEGMQRFNELRFSGMQHERIIFHDAGDVGPETAVELRQAVAEGDIVVLAADRLGDRDDDAVDVQLLDGTVSLPVGPWVVAHLLACPVFAVFACRQDGYYRLIPFSICDRVDLGDRSQRREAIRGYAQRFSDCMEQVVLQHPEQWYNFYLYWREEA